VRVLYHVDARGLIRSTGADDVLVLPSVAHLQVRVNAGGFWPGRGSGAGGAACSAAVHARRRNRDHGRTIARAARYVKVLAL